MAQDAGMEVPALDIRPSVTGFQWLWEAFVELTSCRQMGMSVGPIPWTAIQKYAEAHQLTDGETWLLHGVVQHLDEIFITHHIEKTSGNSKTKRN